MPVARAAPTLVLSVLLACPAEPALALVPRPAPAAATVVSANGDEQLRIPDAAQWLPAELNQALLTGDELRTGAFGGLGLLFADRTQVRVQRNSHLVVKAPSAGGGTQLRLERGGAWSRAAAGSGVRIETVSATAAIRGTQWTLEVDERGTTRLAVAEGTVVLENALGTVTVRPGEIAVVEIGRAPLKSVLVRPLGREQFTLQYALDYALWWFPLTAERREAYDRLSAAAPEGRDRAAQARLAVLALARGESAQAHDHALQLPATDPHRALVLGTLAARAHRYGEADPLLDSAFAGLGGEQRVVAGIHRFVVLARLQRFEEAEKLLKALSAEAEGSPSYHQARGWFSAFQGEWEQSLAQLEGAMKRFPESAPLAALASQVAVLLARPEVARTHALRAVELDPELAIGWKALGDYHQFLAGDARAAVAAYRRAVVLDPSEPLAWNNLGIALYDSDHPHAARQALERSMAAEPGNHLSRQNLALLLMDWHQLAEADVLLAGPRAERPGEPTLLTAECRLRLHTGETAQALERCLAATTASPLSAEAELYTAVAYHQLGEPARVDQALGNATRLDGSDPTVPWLASILAADRFQVDEAIEQAQKAMELHRRGKEGALVELASARSGAINLGSAFQLVGLADWARYYGDLSSSPFDANSQFFRLLQAEGHPEAPALAIQGLLLDPLAVSGRNRHLDILYRPFTDFTLAAEAGDQRTGGTATLQGYSNRSAPLAWYASLSQSDVAGEWAEPSGWEGNGTMAFGSRPTVDDRIYLALLRSDGSSALPGSPAAPTPWNRGGTEVTDLTVGYGRSLGDRNELLTLLSLRRQSLGLRLDGSELLPGLILDDRVVTDSRTAALRHLFETGPAVVSYGAETTRYEVTDMATAALGDAVLASESAVGDREARAAHLDARWSGDRLDLELGLFHQSFEGETPDRRTEPRAGIAWRPADGQQLRFAARSDMELPATWSLTPSDTVGLLPSRPPLEDGGVVSTVMGRWDAEWNQRFFTALELQDQRLDHYRLTGPDGITGIEAEKGRIRSAALAANLWMGGGWGLAGRYRWNWSENLTSGLSGGPDLPGIPDYQADLGLTWVHPAYLKGTFALSHVGPRSGDVPGEITLDAYTTVGLSMTWEPFDRRVALGMEVRNLLDEDYEVFAGTPGTGTEFLFKAELRM